MSSTTEEAKVVGVVCDAAGGLTVTVWLKSPGEQRLLCDVPCRTMGEVQEITNSHALRRGVPLHRVEFVHK